jgi:hypothetical protein
MSYRERMHDECLAVLTERLLEIGRMEAEGKTPPEELERLRWIAHEGFRLGRPVGDAEYDAAHAPPSAPAVAPKREVQLEPREWPRQKPQATDVLADYRGRADYQRSRWLEPELI